MSCDKMINSVDPDCSGPPNPADEEVFKYRQINKSNFVTLKIKDIFIISNCDKIRIRSVQLTTVKEVTFHIITILCYCNHGLVCDYLTDRLTFISY